MDAARAASRRTLGALLIAIVTLPFSRLPAAASQTEFDVAVHRFQVTGNMFGSAGLVDDFSSGSLAPHWGTYFGTANESGGLLHLTSPGADYPYVPYANVVLDQSAVLGPTAFKGQGDFVAQSAWDASVPDLNNYSFFAIGNGTGLANQEAVAIGVWNLDAATAEALHAPGPGFAVTQTHDHISQGVFTTNDTSTVTLDPSQITGLIVLQIAYDDTADVVTTSFSLDGGSTFQSPFSTNQLPRYNAGVSFALVTDPVILTGQPPSPIPTSTAIPSLTSLPLPTPTNTAVPSLTSPPLPTPINTAVPSLTSPPLPTPINTAVPCVGDCERRGMVSVNDLVKGVNIALGAAALSDCSAFDCNDNGDVTVDCLVKAVDAALAGCP